MSVKTDIPVLVVGAGPTGLMMASELKRRGVHCRIVDKLPNPTDKSKALVLHARTVELLEIMGIAQKFIPKGLKGHGASIFAHGKRVLHISFDELESKFPFALMIPQNETEGTFNEHLNSLGIKVERSVELIGFQQTSNCVTATLKHPDGTEEIVTAQYIIGCDGSHSTVRHVLGFPFEGKPYGEMFALADVIVDWDQHDDEVITFLEDKFGLAFFPMKGHRYRILVEVEGEKGPDDKPTLEEFQALCDKYVPGKCVLSDPVWLAYFKIHRRFVNQYRQERAFLCGDAGHIHSPVGGQGMNTGLQDAFNLAWKLALVVRGEAPQSLLDSYQQERHAVAKALLAGTDLATKAATLRNPVALGIRNALSGVLMNLEVVQQRMMKNGSMLAVHYRHSDIVGQHRGTMGGGLRALEGQIASWLDFAHGPSPGDRAPDAEVQHLGKTEVHSLYEDFRGIDHNLLLFAGLDDSSASYERLKEFAGWVRDKYGSLIRTHIIASSNNVPDGVKSHPSILVDVENSAHNRYGAAHECMYLIRPDTYVGFRSQPTDFEALEKHLEEVLLKQTAKV
jgi:2-polyprenyl-6-methoxyphenol hydroxylase-like FAD-dependent oxidoreductase